MTADNIGPFLEPRIGFVRIGLSPIIGRGDFATLIWSTLIV